VHAEDIRFPWVELLLDVDLQVVALFDPLPGPVSLHLQALSSHVLLGAIQVARQVYSKARYK
jgi:hypothetical protein